MAQSMTPIGQAVLKSREGVRLAAGTHDQQPMTVETADAYSFACAFFRQSVSSGELLLPFVAGMRAICAGVEAGVLTASERDALISTIEAARPGLVGLAHDHALDAARQASPYLLCLDPRQTLGNVQQTIGLVLAWGAAPDERGDWSPGYLAGHCALIRLFANTLENVVWSERAACGVFQQPDHIREHGEGLVFDIRSTTDADVSRPHPGQFRRVQ